MFFLFFFWGAIHAQTKPTNEKPKEEVGCPKDVTMSIPDFAYSYVYRGVYQWMNDTSQPFSAPYLNRGACLPSRITGFGFSQQTTACKAFEKQIYVLKYTGGLIRWLVTSADLTTWESALLQFLPEAQEPTAHELVCLATNIGTLVKALLSITIACCMAVVVYLVYSWHAQKRRDEVQSDREAQLADAIMKLEKKQ